MRKIYFLLILILITSFVYAGGIDAQRFKPSIGLKGMVITDTSETLEPLDFGAFLYLHYDKDPFVRTDINGNEEKLLSNVFYGDALFTIAIIKNLEMGIVLPFSMYSSSDSSVTNVSKVSLGDIRLGLKYALSGMMIKNLGIGFTLNGYFPTGDPESFNSSDGVNIQPGFLLDYRFDKFLLAFNVSYMMKLSDAKIADVALNDEVGFRIGGKYSITDDFEAMLELFGAFQATNAFKLKEETPLELMLTANYYLGDIKFNAGGAIGLVSGVGTPLFRVIVGVGYVKREGDSDKDGLSDKNDKCPNKAEDKDGFEDTDGCPDLDNDKDGILDAQDKCPMDAEDIDKFEDEDGCPDLDNDNDGIADTDDKCPDVAETVNSFEDTDGCPDEVPILDADKDGIVDAQDKCPNDAEDKDGFEDEDGCPELDNDKDGILDAQDKCPLEAETVNGFEDEDGCPDKKPELVKINVETKKIEILEKVFFNTASSKINPNSYELLKKVATIINENKDIKKIVVEGHTDDLGNATTNKNLSQRRAQSVVEFLVKEKVSKKRLSAKGYGEEKPIVPVVGLIKKLKDKKIKKEEKEEIETKLDKNRSMNRRVEFTIIK